MPARASPLWIVSAQQTALHPHRQSALGGSGSGTMTPRPNAYRGRRAGPCCPRHAGGHERPQRSHRRPSGSRCPASGSSLDRVSGLACAVRRCDLFDPTVLLSPAFPAWPHHDHDTERNRPRSTTLTGWSCRSHPANRVAGSPSSDARLYGIFPARCFPALRKVGSNPVPHRSRPPGSPDSLSAVLRSSAEGSSPCGITPPARRFVRACPQSCPQRGGDIGRLS